MEDYQFNYKPELSELNSGLGNDSLVEEVRKSASEGCALYYDVWSINRDVAMRLKAIRKSKGLTLKEVSKISGVPEVTLGNVERLKGITTLPVLVKYASALGCHLDIGVKENEK